MSYKINNKRSNSQKIFDNIFFPIRALFIPEETFLGLTSLRDERMELVSKYAFGKVLDIGCGPKNIFVNNFLKSDSVGIDVYEYEGVNIVHKDMTNLPFDSESFDCVTLIAVGGHIPKDIRVKEFEEITRVLKTGGRLIMTEGEPITQTIGHIYRHFSFALIGKKDMDTERGMEEEEEYCMPHKEIIKYLNKPPLKFSFKKKFMWGLNNIFIATKN
jgi:SAM-dependent methyltransferase